MSFTIPKMRHYYTVYVGHVLHACQDLLSQCLPCNVPILLLSLNLMFHLSLLQNDCLMILKKKVLLLPRFLIFKTLSEISPRKCGCNKQPLNPKHNLTTTKQQTSCCLMVKARSTKIQCVPPWKTVGDCRKRNRLCELHVKYVRSSVREQDW